MKNFSQGFLTGLFLGGLAGLMNASQPGYQTREDLKYLYDQTKSDFEEFGTKIEELSHSIQSLTTESQHALKQVEEMSNETAQNFIDETAPYIRRMNKNLKEINQTIQNYKTQESDIVS